MFSDFVAWLHCPLKVVTRSISVETYAQETDQNGRKKNCIEIRITRNRYKLNGCHQTNYTYVTMIWTWMWMWIVEIDTYGETTTKKTIFELKWKNGTFAGLLTVHIFKSRKRKTEEKENSKKIYGAIIIFHLFWWRVKHRTTNVCSFFFSVCVVWALLNSFLMKRQFNDECEPRSIF